MGFIAILCISMCLVVIYKFPIYLKKIVKCVSNCVCVSVFSSTSEGQVLTQVSLCSDVLLTFLLPN